MTAIPKQDLIKWKAKPAENSHGIITGCSNSQEWLLPWWWMHYQMHNSEYPVTFLDFGDMSPNARAWCNKRGSLLTLPAKEIESFIAARDAVPSERFNNWEKHKNLDVWAARKEWFKKPFACLASPYEKTLWIDLDCQVRNSLTPLFTFTSSTPYDIALTKEPDAVMKVHRDSGDLLEGEIEFNTGVIGFEHGSPLVQEWARQCLENSHFLRGDQEVITRHLFNEGIRIAEFSDKYVQRGSFSEETNTFSPVAPSNIILHWCGSYQKYIFFQMECLKLQSLINFF